MDAEPQVESLMQLLNDALKELENLDKRLIGYDSRLKVNSLIPSYSVEICLVSKCYLEWSADPCNFVRSRPISGDYVLLRTEPSDFKWFLSISDGANQHSTIPLDFE